MPVNIIIDNIAEKMLDITKNQYMALPDLPVEG